MNPNPESDCLTISKGERRGRVAFLFAIMFLGAVTALTLALSASVAQANKGTALYTTSSSAPTTLRWIDAPTVTSNTLNDVDMLTSNDGWAVGAAGTVLHYNGSVWSPVAIGTQGALADVRMLTTNDGFIVDRENKAIYRWDGTQWNLFYTADRNLNRVDAVSADNVWATGIGKIYHCNPCPASGGTWTEDYVSPTGSNIFSIQMFVGSQGVEGWATGAATGDNNGALLVHYLNGTWTRYIPSPSSNALYDSFFDAPNDGWAVGFTSTTYIVRYDGIQWSRAYTLTDQIDHLSILSPTEGWLSGPATDPGSPDILHFLNGTFIPERNSSNFDYLTSIDMLSRTDGWAVGSTGLMVHYVDDGTPSPTATGGTTSTATRTPTVAATATCVPAGTLEFVTIVDNSYDPQTVTVPAGTTVLWTNGYNHSYAHTTTSNTGLWDSGSLNDGGQFSYTFYTPGTYAYHCSIHSGMTGTIIVTPASPCATNTAAPPTATRTNTTVPTTSTAIPITQTPGGATATTQPSATATAVATSTACSLSFSDVTAESTFYPFIRCLACRGVISGYSDGTFRPGNDITRGQIAKMVSNAAGFSEDPGPQVFQDVDQNNTFYIWINRLSNLGFMGGYACGNVPTEPCVSPADLPYFRPFANTTRGQLAKIVSNAAGVTGDPTDLYYTDVPQDNPFYLWIMRLTNIGVMSGYDCGRPGEACDDQNRPYFRPFANVTRGQASKIVANTFFPNCDTPLR